MQKVTLAPHGEVDAKTFSLMSNLQIIRRDQVLAAQLSEKHRSTFDGQIVRLFWIETGPDVTTFLCEGTMSQPQQWYHESATADGQPVESLLIELPPGHTYLGLTAGLGLLEVNERPWLVAKGPLPRGTLEKNDHPRLRSKSS